MREHVRAPAATLAGLAIWLAVAAIPAAAAGPRAAHTTPAVQATRATRSAHATAARGPASGLAARAVGGPALASPGIAVNYPASGAIALPQVPASAYVVADAGTGQVLAAKDAHGLFPPASTLKVLTAITLIPLLNPDATVLASSQAAQTPEYDVGLVAGRRYKVSDLFDALLLISANDAAVALTQATGSLARGMALINAEAHHLQAYDVVAMQPNGLPAVGQVVSAYDQALIARQALAMPAFMKYDSTLSAEFPVTPHTMVPLVNQNRLLTQYQGGIGGKIGWTEAAEATYIGMARRHGVTLIVTVLHCTPLQEITVGEELLNWGFAMDGKVRPVGVLVPPLRAAVAARHGGRPRAGKPDASSAKPGGRRAMTGRADAGAKPAMAPGQPTWPLTASAGLLAVAGLVAGKLARRQRRRRANPAGSRLAGNLAPPRPPDGPLFLDPGSRRVNSPRQLP